MKKKYSAQTKINSTEWRERFVTDLISYTAYLDKEFPDWRFFNVMAHQEDGTKVQIANFTKNNRPTQRFIPKG